jgi:hypothetical protein
MPLKKAEVLMPEEIDEFEEAIDRDDWDAARRIAARRRIVGYRVCSYEECCAAGHPEMFGSLKMPIWEDRF